jgi:hypothetical protein
VFLNERAKLLEICSLKLTELSVFGPQTRVIVANGIIRWGLGISETAKLPSRDWCVVRKRLLGKSRPRWRLHCPVISFARHMLRSNSKETDTASDGDEQVGKSPTSSHCTSSFPSIPHYSTPSRQAPPTLTDSVTLTHTVTVTHTLDTRHAVHSYHSFLNISLDLQRLCFA